MRMTILLIIAYVLISQVDIQVKVIDHPPRVSASAEAESQNSNIQR